jgi:hypothetical protein
VQLFDGLWMRAIKIVLVRLELLASGEVSARLGVDPMPAAILAKKQNSNGGMVCV